jgi:hypothetical protein
MKLFDVKAALVGSDHKTHWRTIGTVFASDNGSLLGVETGNFDKEQKPILKPAGFTIDWPPCQGIIVPRPKKPREPGEDDNHPPTDEKSKPS